MTGSLTIVGAGPGLGSSLARRFASGGWSIGLIAREPETVDACRTDAASVADVNVVGAVADVTDEDALDAALQSLHDAIGLGVVIYNASIFQAENALELTHAQLQLALNVHVVGAHNTAKSAVTRMREADQGVLVFTINCLALHPQAASTALSIGKGAQLNLALSLEQELASTGIKVAVVTITQPIVAGTAFDPDRIAEVYWDVAQQDARQLRTRPRVRRELNRAPRLWFPSELVGEAEAGAAGVHERVLGRVRVVDRGTEVADHPVDGSASRVRAAAGELGADHRDLLAGDRDDPFHLLEREEALHRGVGIVAELGEHGVDRPARTAQVVVQQSDVARDRSPRACRPRGWRRPGPRRRRGTSSR